MTQEPHSVLEKVVLVHAPEVDVGCLARVRVGHDRSLGQGYITIRINLALAGFDNESQVLILNIVPEKVDTCTVRSSGDDIILPARMLNMIRGVTCASAVSTLTLCLNAAGVVLVPPGVGTTVSPVNQGDVKFDAFSKICQAKTIHLHFSKQQFLRNDQLWLRRFASALRRHLLDPPPLNYIHFNGGRGVQERDWTVFERSLNPPPYQQIVSSNCVLGKRSRDSEGPSVSGSASQRVAPSPCSPPPWSTTEVNTPTEVNASTEVNESTGVNTPTRTNAPAEDNTPSTYSPSHIHPTIFTRGPEITPEDRLTIQRLQRSLATVPDHLVREILRGSGHQHLLAMQREAEIEFSFDCEHVTAAKVERIIERRLDRYVEERLGPLTLNAFKSFTRQRLDRLVEAGLPVAADLYLNGAVESYRDQFYEDCKTNEANFHETVEEGRIQLRATADELSTEIQEFTQNQIAELQEQGESIGLSVEDKLEKLSHCAQSLERQIAKLQEQSESIGASLDGKLKKFNHCTQGLAWSFPDEVLCPGTASKATKRCMSL